MGPVGQFLSILGGGVGVPTRGVVVVVAVVVVVVVIGGLAVVTSGGALGMFGVVAAVEAVGTVGIGGPAVGTVGTNGEKKRSTFDIPCMRCSGQATFSFLEHEPKSGSKFNPSAHRRRATSSPFTHTR